jgi:X-X-X-Leu-X-X-Gly heptad repeat protein
LDKSLSQLSGGIGDMAGGAASLRGGASEIASGASSLSDGVAELYDGVSDMPEETKKRIDEFAADYDKSDYEPRSFASPRNSGVTLVQFVLRTDEIKKPEAPKPAEEETEETSFIGRLLSLFGVK